MASPNIPWSSQFDLGFPHLGQFQGAIGEFFLFLESSPADLGLCPIQKIA